MSRMSAHQSATSNGVDWLTPPVWLKGTGVQGIGPRGLGEFDLDPCCPPNMPWRTAKTMWTRADNPLERDWEGRVWLNPPYGPPRIIEPWMKRMALNNNGVALTFARTDTNCWHRFIFPKAAGALFVEGRPNFHLANGTKSTKNCGAPVALVAYGADNLLSLVMCRIPGKVVVFNESESKPVERPHDRAQLVHQFDGL